VAVVPVRAGAVVDESLDVDVVPALPRTGSGVCLSNPVVPGTALAFSSRLLISLGGAEESVVELTPGPDPMIVLSVAGSLFVNVNASPLLSDDVSDGSVWLVVGGLLESAIKLDGVSRVEASDSGRSTAPAEGSDVVSVVVGLGFDVRVDLAGRLVPDAEVESASTFPLS